MSYKSHLEKIQEAKNDNKLVFFIGSGMSKNVGLPDWGELMEEFKKELKTEESDYLKIAQLYFLEFGEYEYNKKIRSFFPLEKIKAQDIHKLLIKIFPQYIITTNWDNVIEKAIDDEMALYDIVRNDAELINTSSIRKLIKMHGDIELGNIIFKEDDYLEYSQKFPLVENYVKSILSTNIVVFLGYSYNDINLKYITKWLQNNSTARPPAYIIVFKEDKVQEKYFKNHGISVLNISIKYPFKDKTLQIEHFLKNILKANDLFSHIKNESQLIDEFFNLLQNFKLFDIILIDQLHKLLQSKSIRYRINYDNSNRTILHLPSYYTLIDNIFKKFRLTVPKENRFAIITKIKYIIKVLHKCGIVGIAISDDKYHLLKEKVFNQTYALKDMVLNFNIGSDVNKKENAYFDVHNSEYEKAYLMYKELVIFFKKEKNYIDMFFAMYNSNITLSYLKIFNKDAYIDVEKYDISEKFLELKQRIRESLEPLISILKNDSFLYKYVYDIKTFHEKRQEQIKIIENGGMAFANNETEARQKHKNLLLFVNNNYLCIDIYTDFKNLQKEFIKATLTRQFRDKYKTLDKFELYACIKYLDNKELKIIFDTFYTKDTKEFKKFQLDDDKKSYLLQVLENLTSILSNIAEIDQIQIYEEYWINTLYLLSLAEYIQIESIVDIFSKALKIRGSISIYEEINLFLRIQKYAFNVQIRNDILYQLLELVINKILSSNYNAWDMYALENNTLFGYLLDENIKDKYNNEALINSLLITFKKFELRTQVNLSKYFLLNIYDYSNDSIKESIKNYIFQIDIEELELMDLLEFKLLLMTREFITVDDFDFEDKIHEYIEPYIDGKSFSSFLFRIKDLLSYFVSQKQAVSLSTVLKDIEEIILQHESLKKW